MDGVFLKEGQENNSVSIIFSLDEEVGALAEGLKIFKVSIFSLIILTKKDKNKLPTKA